MAIGQCDSRYVEVNVSVIEPCMRRDVSAALPYPWSHRRTIGPELLDQPAQCFPGDASHPDEGTVC